MRIFFIFLVDHIRTFLHAYVCITPPQNNKLQCEFHLYISDFNQNDICLHNFIILMYKSIYTHRCICTYVWMDIFTDQGCCGYSHLQ